MKRHSKIIFIATITLLIVLSCAIPTVFAGPVDGTDGIYGSKGTTARMLTSYFPDSAFLNDLKITNGTLSPAFSPDTLKYTVALDENTSSFNIDAVKADPLDKVYMNSRLVISGRVYTLDTGAKRVIKVKVVTPTGKARTYTVTFTRAKSTNADLGSLKVKGYKVLPVERFDDLRTEKMAVDYICIVPLGTKKVTLYAAAAERHAWLSINGRVVKSRTITLKSMPLPGDVGPKTKTPNIVTIIVKAQAGNMKSYTLMIGYGAL